MAEVGPPPTETEEQDQDEQNTEEDDGDDDNQTQQPSNPIVGGGGSTVYPKILISEVQVGGLTDQKEEFLELYNPNDSVVDLTGWYLQKKTKTGSNYSSFASNSLFSNKKIESKGYFLIARDGSSFSALADIIIENSLTEDNFLVLKNPNGERADMLGFGLAQDYETSPAQNPENGRSIGRKWDIIEQDTDNNLVDFEAQVSTPKTQNIAYTVPLNEGEEEEDEEPVPTDTVAPSVVFNLDATQNSLSFTINFDIIDPMTTVSPSGIDSYVFRWQAEGGSWQEDPEQKIGGCPTSANFEREFIGEDETNYYFQIKTKDLVGNESDWQPETPAETRIVLPKKILINEIQIAGLTDEKEEFVELYNPSAIDIDLSGCYLQRKTKEGDDYSTFISGANFSGQRIKSKGYFLIARENSVFSDLADLVVDNPLTEDNSLVLKNPKREIVDKVGWGEASDFEGSPALNPLNDQSIQRKWDSIANTFQDTDDNSADFEIQEHTPNQSTPKVKIWDGTGDVAEGSPPDYSSSKSNSGNVNYYKVKIKWDSNSSDLDFYDVQYKVNDGNWQDWLLQTTETEKIYDAYYSMFTDYVYYFRAKAQNKDGNQGEWAEITVDVTNPVIINEIALFGTNASKTDQWIELYNRSENDVDLTGWRIVTGASGFINFNEPLQGIIPAKGYALFEFGDDDNISDIEADEVFTAYLSNQTHLENPNKRQVDKLYTPSHYGDHRWWESDFVIDDNCFSMERVSPYSFGTNSKNWKINNGITINGHDREGGLIYGTPGQPNSVDQIYTSLSADFFEDITLPLSRSPYLIYSNSLAVHENKILTIEPGVVIKFYDGYGSAGIKIDGTLKAIGEPGFPIVFTSFFNDSYGGDTDGDPEQINLGAGNWLGLQFSEYATDSSELDNVVVSYAGSKHGDLHNAGIRVDQVAISLRNSTIENNLRTGILLVNSSSIVDNVNILNHEIVPGYDPYGGEGICIQGGSPQIMNSLFSGNVYGVYISDWWDLNNAQFTASVLFSNNSFMGSLVADIWDANNPPPPPES